jgi:hypothetical protein
MAEGSDRDGPTSGMFVASDVCRVTDLLTFLFKSFVKLLTEMATFI